jgi:SAM-dependent methyltransferase
MQADLIGLHVPTDSYGHSFQEPSAAGAYAQLYMADSSDAFIGEMQRKWLRTLVVERFGAVPFQHVDFACGTGRILQYLSDLAATSIGLDVSPEMLKYAELAVPSARLYALPLERPLQFSTAPRVMTAYRLLLNSPVETHKELMTFAREVLPDRDAGILVLNNHGNVFSSRRLTTIGRSEHVNHLRMRYVRDLLQSNGFEVIRSSGGQLFPGKLLENKRTAFVARRVEELFADTKLARTAGVDVSLVAVRH